MISEKVSNLIVTKSQPPVPKNERDSSYTNPSYDPQIIESIVYSPRQGAISTILSEMDLIPNSQDFPTPLLRLLLSQLSKKSLRRGVGLLRDEAYWKLRRINLHPQSRSIPGGLGRKEIQRVFKAMNFSQPITATRRTLNLWEFRVKQ